MAPTQQATTPVQVAMAGLLLWVLVGLTVLRTALSVFVLDLYENDLALAFVTLALVAGLLGLCAYYVPRGSRAARVVAAMLTFVTGMGGLASALAPTSTLFALLGAIGAVASTAVLLLLITAPARAFFRRRRQS